MRVKELTLQGFKSFAAKHRFVFPSGVTAVVGPNGSGKSNIADSIRWVLGEQRATSMRARRTEDMIFAGSERRARSGLAEVSLVLDNESRWLDLDFSEVVVTRRATRDGTNAYLINGAQVRLRDVQDLLAGPLGQGAYTVIGQGLVDSALSLRPDERRVLIDEAAGIVPLQRRRTRALHQLAETEENLTRVDDILGELGPQIKRMSRLADRAVRFESITSELRENLTTWYGYHLHRARDERRRRTDAVVELQSALADVDRRISRQKQTIGTDEEAFAAIEAELVSRRSAVGRAERLLADARQAVAVATTRQEAMRQRDHDLEVEAVADERLVAASSDRVGSLEGALAPLREANEDLQLQAAAAREALLAAESQMSEQRSEADQATQRLHEARAAAEAIRQQLSALETSRSDRDAERKLARESLAKAVAQHERLDADASEAAESASSWETRASDAADAESEAASALEDARGAAALAEAAAADARTELAALRARLEAITAVVETTDAEPALLERLSSAQGSALRGSVASLLEIETGWEDAVAVALGSWVRGIVVADDIAVDGGLAVVADGARGQIVFVPLASRTPVREWRVEHGEATAEQVAKSPGVDGLVTTLLADTAFVQDVDGARAALARSNGPKRAATADGQLFLGGGVVVTGSRDADVVRLAADRPGLSEAVGSAGEAADVASGEAARLSQVQIGLAEKLAEAHKDRLEADRQMAAATGRRDSLDRQAEASATEQQRIEDRCARLDRAADDAAALQERLSEQLAVATELAAKLSGEADEARERAVQGDVTALLREAEAAADEAAKSAAALAARESEIQAIQRDTSSAQLRLDDRLDRHKQLVEETARIEATLAQANADAEASVSELENSIAALRETEDQTRVARDRARTAGAQLDELRQTRSTTETGLAEARVTAARAEDALDHLQEQMRHDAELLEPLSAGRSGAASRGLDGADAVHAAVEAAVDGAGADVGADANAAGSDAASSTTEDPESDGLVTERDEAANGDSKDEQFEERQPELIEPDPVTELPEGLDEQVAVLRRQLRAVGAVDREALATYRETESHYEDLTAQRSDLESAANDLMTMITQLESDMSARFERTFAEVATAFRSYFPQLFGGGEADLVLQEGESDPGGIDIEARPPGKRRQPLSLLSGGERALTAVALVFALLHVSRTPFAVLDEVDAALDEANVDRFCNALTSLAQKTQVVIVTHNRGTIEAADTVYGITMADDGASQAISLQVGNTA